MANVNELFDEIKNEKSYFKPENSSSEKKRYARNIEGEFLGHIFDAETRIVEFKGYKARVYNFKFKVHGDNAAREYQVPNIKNELETISGIEYVGRVYRSKGVFRFLEPSKDDDFKSNSEGNRGYLSLCSAIGKECQVVTQSVDGEEVEFQELPTINLDDLNGMPVIATIKSGKAYKDKNGNERHYMDVKWVNKWTNGVRLNLDEETKNDEIPF